ncbi:MAG: DUF424 family protein [Candidatus Micrarchaeota archaeon]|nr:DUF424 family protein [Candidatus Micrarchaeota archaeon]
MIYLKVHKSEHGSVIGMCDKELIDSVLEEGDVTIDVKSYASFYKGDLLNQNQASKRLEEHLGEIYSANIVGKESVGIAMAVSLIHKDNVKRISGVPYAHAYKII